MATILFKRSKEELMFQAGRAFGEIIAKEYLDLKPEHAYAAALEEIDEIVAEYKSTGWYTNNVNNITNLWYIVQVRLIGLFGSMKGLGYLKGFEEYLIRQNERSPEHYAPGAEEPKIVYRNGELKILK